MTILFCTIVISAAVISISMAIDSVAREVRRLNSTISDYLRDESEDESGEESPWESSGTS